MTHSTDMLYLVTDALVNIEESIERHADLAQAQIQVDAWKAGRHIDLMLERYKIEDVFRNRSRGQLRRWAAIKGVSK
jgi:hypothetical protein